VILMDVRMPRAAVVFAFDHDLVSAHKDRG
jgi:hypothetical protein